LPASFIAQKKVNTPIGGQFEAEMLQTARLCLCLSRAGVSGGGDPFAPKNVPGMLFTARVLKLSWMRSTISGQISVPTMIRECGLTASEFGSTAARTSLGTTPTSQPHRRYRTHEFELTQSQAALQKKVRDTKLFKLYNSSGAMFFSVVIEMA
jgi:hypothetical protein